MGTCAKTDAITEFYARVEANKHKTRGEWAIVDRTVYYYCIHCGELTSTADNNSNFQVLPPCRPCHKALKNGWLE